MPPSAANLRDQHRSSVIVGGVTGGGFTLFLLGVLIAICRMYWKRRQEKRRKNRDAQQATEYADTEADPGIGGYLAEGPLPPSVMVARRRIIRGAGLAVLFMAAWAISAWGVGVAKRRDQRPQDGGQHPTSSLPPAGPAPEDTMSPSRNHQQTPSHDAVRFLNPENSAAPQATVANQPSAENELPIASIMLQRSGSFPTIALTPATESSNEDFRRWTVHCNDVRTESGEVRSGLVVPTPGKILRRELRSTRVVMPVPPTPVLCRRKDRDDASVSSLDLDERYGDLSEEPVEEYRSMV
ncbi:hypothetical protein LTR36_007321 [Oleoguttula mirabilis]|uniref:Transmembrane protein n=1 Tax=Oleoguttula mirabilis TaxID=1507867 RepID=A0AAV9JA09_9PEZI|nr:hypothetical protein LTR36_007321 [Oleoguttula mirabilis]